jgi:hypothetical protein
LFKGLAWKIFKIVSYEFLKLEIQKIAQFGKRPVTGTPLTAPIQVLLSRLGGLGSVMVITNGL